MELVLVLDVSGSMRGQTSSVVAFAQDVVDQFELSHSLTRVGVVEFSSSSSTLIGMSATASEVSTAISGLSSPGGWTDISSALARGARLISAGGRPCVDEKCVMLLLTDGQQSSQYGGDSTAIASAGDVKAAGIKLFAVGFAGAQRSTLDAMASSPASRYSYLGSNLADIRAHFATFCALASSPGAPP